ncbi:MAG TPA: hypothetical protein VN976_03010 [Verrucomicrobiae bacterium]|nr:hypothetical protein [Verrucomicrobiae bacterium]
MTVIPVSFPGSAQIAAARDQRRDYVCSGPRGPERSVKRAVSPFQNRSSIAYGHYALAMTPRRFIIAGNEYNKGRDTEKHFIAVKENSAYSFQFQIGLAEIALNEETEWTGHGETLGPGT